MRQMIGQPEQRFVTAPCKNYGELGRDETFSPIATTMRLLVQNIQTRILACRIRSTLQTS